jgi:hypothetical protein
MCHLSTLDVRREDVGRLAECLGSGSGSSEDLGIAPDSKDTDVDVLVRVLGEVTLDLILDLPESATSL